MTAQEIAIWIDAERQRLGMSQVEMIRRAGVTVHTLRKIQSGAQYSAYQITLEALANAVGAEVVVRKKEDAR